MANKTAVQFGTHTGYSDWSVLRTIREAENIARWNPWKAHEWMDEAYQRLDIYGAPYHDEYEAAVQRINSLWRANTKCHWYDPKEFWKDGKVSLSPKMLESLYDV
jgi:hypothetical protein